MPFPNSDPPSNSSEAIYRQSCGIFPGGVNSPVRSFAAVGGTPFIAERGEGAWLYDRDGKCYVDYVMSWGPLVLGHAPECVIEAISHQARKGVSYGAPTRDELILGSLLRERMPWIERLRFVNSGTEACMTAVRLARAATGRSVIVKFDGCYHGHSDAFLVKAGSGMATGGLPSSGGVPEAVTRATVSLPYNNIAWLTEHFEKSGHEIAAVIVEPIAANMGVIPPRPGFLETLRDLCSRHGAILIFDEVITGFRVAPGGAAEFFHIKPDLVCLGKIIGGGLPVGAVGGRRELLDQLAPLGNVYQAGTLSGNPLAMAAGAATLKALSDPRLYDSLKCYADEITGRLLELATHTFLPLRINKVESLFTVFFSEREVTDFESACACDMKQYARFFRCLLKHGVFLPPSGYEAWFISTAHQAEHLELTISAARHFMEKPD